MIFLKIANGKCIFKKALMENDKYNSWLKPGTTLYLAKCSVCISEFNVAWWCESAVRSHERGSTLVRNMIDIESAKKSLASLFFRKTPAHSDVNNSLALGNWEKLATPFPSSQSTRMYELVSQQASVTRVEIIWVLRLVQNHYSFCSCLEVGDDLKDMFPSNDVVSNFKLLKTKCVYLVIHGIAPWVKKKMCKLGCPTLHSTVCHLMSH